MKSRKKRQMTFPLVDLRSKAARALGISHGRALFSSTWYLKQVHLTGRDISDPFKHYMEIGWKQNLSPHPLFDGLRYLYTYEDVAAAGKNPLIHFLRFGARENRTPHALFDASHYRKQLKRLRPRNLLLHYLQFGATNKLSPHPLFDAEWYLTEYPDVAAQGCNPLCHYIESGASEGRSPHPLFDTGYYNATNPDVVRAGLNPLLHYVSSGWKEDRCPHPFFDTKWYRKLSKLDHTHDPLLHFLQKGDTLNVSPHPLFDCYFYTARNKDKLSEGMSPFMHFVRCGMRSNLAPNGLFDPQFYLEHNADVQTSGINAAAHYIAWGWKDGRDFSALFDPQFYRQQMEASCSYDGDLLKHYFEHGHKCGLAPHPLFDVKYYENSVGKSELAGREPVAHYFVEGAAKGYEPNELFDGEYYIRNHETLRTSGMNPLLHYITTGVSEGRDPHPWFDTDYYLTRNPDVRAAKINPLAHFLLSGRAEGRSSGNINAPWSRRDVLDIPFEILKPPGVLTGKNVCIFVIFSANGRIFDYVFSHIAAIRGKGWSVIAVVATNGLALPLPNRLLECEGVLLRRNHGLDFAAWAAALSALPELWQAANVLLTNDSIYGPLSQSHFDKLITKIINSEADIVALTDSYQGQHHFMSFFWVLKQTALQSTKTADIFTAVRSINKKDDVIWTYEVNLLKSFRENGLTVDILFPTQCDRSDPKNPTLAYWRELLSRGFPYLKVQLLRDKLDNYDNSGWRDMLASSQRMLTEIDEHLTAQTGARRQGEFLPFPAGPRRYTRPAHLKTFYGATASTRVKPDADVVLRVPFSFVPSHVGITAKTAAIIHCFYSELIDEMVDYLAQSPIKIDLFISTDTDEKRIAILDRIKHYTNGAVVVKVFENIGRDIAPMLIGFRNVFFEYDLFLHIHTKKSPHDGFFSGWRRFLLQNLVGSREIIASILTLLEQNNIGIVCSDHFEAVRPLLNWGYDFAQCKAILGRCGFQLTVNHCLDFPSSSFFWGKTAAIKPLLDNNLDWSDFPPESGQVDGTLAHAIERSILYICEVAGYDWIKVANDPQGDPSRLAPVLADRDLPTMIKVFGRRLTGAQILPIEYFERFGEVRLPAVRGDGSGRKRLNLLLPTLRPEKVFGGITTALTVFGALRQAAGSDFDARIIVTSDALDLKSTRALKDYIVVSLGAGYDTFGATVVDISDQSYGHDLPIRENDVFVATAWWTAQTAQHLADQQLAFFGRSFPIVYLVQDFEPGFYQWSGKFGLSHATYRSRHGVIALINSEELAEFVARRIAFEDAYVVRYTPNAKIEAARRRLPRERIILVYGRPSVERNCFDTLRTGLMLWQHANPHLVDTWMIISVGEAYDPKVVSHIDNIHVAGKLTLDEYGEILSKASIGISLMISPHPSYPPFEMAAAGLYTISNNYENKDMARRSDMFITLNEITPHAVAEALERAVQTAEPNIGQIRAFGTIKNLPCDLPDYTAERLMARLRREFAGSNRPAGTE